MLRRTAAALLAAAAAAGLPAACGGDSGTPTADGLDGCLADIDPSLERTPSDAGYGADVEYLGSVEGRPVAVYVAEGDTDPRAVYEEARRGEADRRRYVRQSGQEDDPDFVNAEVRQHGDVVLTYAESLGPEALRRLEECVR